MILHGKFRLRYELYKNSSYFKMSFKILKLQVSYFTDWFNQNYFLII
jgi:hypothetical protein